jgi:hypothetical protein
MCHVVPLRLGARWLTCGDDELMTFISETRLEGSEERGSVRRYVRLHDDDSSHSAHP